MEKPTQSTMEVEETGSYLQLSFSRAPKKNQESLAPAGKAMDAMARQTWGKL